VWFPDAFAGPMADLLRALEEGGEPEISGRDNLETLALCEAAEQGRMQPGQHIVLIGFGAGLAWAAAVVQWGPPVTLRKRTLRERAVRVAIFPFGLARSRALRLWYRLESRASLPPSALRIDDGGDHKDKKDTLN